MDDRCPVCRQPLRPRAALLPCFHRVCVLCVADGTTCLHTVDPVRQLDCLADYLPDAVVYIDLADEEGDSPDDGPPAPQRRPNSSDVCTTAQTASLRASLVEDQIALRGTLVAIDRQRAALEQHVTATTAEITQCFRVLAAREERHCKPTQANGPVAEPGRLKERAASLCAAVDIEVVADRKRLELLRDSVLVMASRVDAAITQLDEPGTMAATKLLDQCRDVHEAMVAPVLTAASLPWRSDWRSSMCFYAWHPFLRSSPAEHTGALVRNLTGSRGRDYTKMIEPIRIFGPRGRGITDTAIDLMGMAVAGNDQLLHIGDRSSSRINTLTLDGEHVSTLPADDLTDLTITPDGSFWVAQHSHNIIAHIDPRTGVTLEERTCACPLSILSLKDKGIIATTISPPSIIVFNTDGSVRWQHKKKNSWCRSPAQISNELVAVLDCNLDQIELFHVETGEPQVTIPLNVGRSHTSSSIIYDPIANLFIVGQVGMLSVVTPWGQPVHSWGTIGRLPGQLVAARDLCLTRSGLLIVLDNGSGRVLVF